jgi:hypothetical protein
MKRNYETGLDANDIHINVTVGTPGVASTGIYLARSGGQRKKIAQSNYQSGNIQNTLVGKSGDVKGSYLLIMTLIDLGILEPSNWPAALSNLSISYEISGGLSGSLQYNFDTDDLHSSTDGKIITVSKPINLL